MTMSSILALAIFVAAFALIATEKINKVIVVLVASAAMVVTGVAPANDIFYSHKVGVDWDVILLLLGMMIIVGVLKQTGVFEYLGIWAGKKSRGHPFRLMVMFMLITAIASPILDNVTIILLVVPVTVVVCNRLHVPAQPYIIAEILASNIGGAATLIGDPPNIIIGNRAGLSFNDFLVHMLPIVALTFALFVVLTRFMFRKDFEFDPEYADSVMALQERRAITDRALLIKCLTVLGLVIVGFTLHSVLHVQPAIIALIGALVMVLVTGVEITEVLAEVEWATLVFFAGLFIMVGALVNTGIIESIGQWAIGAVGHDYTLAGATLLFGSALVGAFFDNIPYATTMAPIVDVLVNEGSDPRNGGFLWWAFALGADFGGNGTAVAASANVVGIGLANRSGHRITFWQFTKYGIVTTVFSTIVAWGYVYLRYIVLA
ncbi:ArsB/NhaD family transporter [Acidipropionibacterium virtanenii]|uniref:Putative transporter n=1 Tax=Acidipropionibacterium virtanenii TaxID=2057246 RepID=A0A344UPN1_9ACTN|nr:ArsB/NhaD family transporter [Acidipropionibacterium virtanenii]AXE37229.1 putative transporter [Acidipropionibacterium virtanenii]